VSFAVLRSRVLNWLQLDRAVQCRCWIWQRKEVVGDPCNAALPWRLSSFALTASGSGIGRGLATPRGRWSVRPAALAGNARHDRDPGGVIERGGARSYHRSCLASGTCQLFRLALSRYRHAVWLCRLQLPCTRQWQSRTTRNSFLRAPILHSRVATDLNSPAANHEGDPSVSTALTLLSLPSHQLLLVSPSVHDIGTSVSACLTQLNTAGGKLLKQAFISPSGTGARDSRTPSTSFRQSDPFPSAVAGSDAQHVGQNPTHHSAAPSIARRGL
jgi:hypothetical protein